MLFCDAASVQCQIRTLGLLPRTEVEKTLIKALPSLRQHFMLGNMHAFGQGNELAADGLSFER